MAGSKHAPPSPSPTATLPPKRPNECCAQICASAVFAFAVASCVLISEAARSCDYLTLSLEPPWINDGDWRLPPLLGGIHEILLEHKTGGDEEYKGGDNHNPTSLRLTESWRRYRDEALGENRTRWAISSNGNDIDNNNDKRNDVDGFCGLGSIGNGTCNDPSLCCSSTGFCGSGRFYCEGESDYNDNDDDKLALLLESSNTTDSDDIDNGTLKMLESGNFSTSGRGNTTLGVSMERDPLSDSLLAGPPPTLEPTAMLWSKDPLTLSMGLFRFEVGSKVDPITKESIAPICVNYDFSENDMDVPLLLTIARWSVVVALALVSLATLIVGIDYVLCALPCRCLRFLVYLGTLGGLFALLLSFVVFADSRCQLVSRATHASSSAEVWTTCSVGTGGSQALWAVATLFGTLVLACVAPTFSRHRRPLVGIVQEYLQEDHGAMGCGCLASCLGSLWLILRGTCENCSRTKAKGAVEPDKNGGSQRPREDRNEFGERSVEDTNLVVVPVPTHIREETTKASHDTVDSDTKLRAVPYASDDSDQLLRDVAVGGYSYKQYYDETAGVTLQNQYNAAYRRWLRFEADYRDALDSFRDEHRKDFDGRTVLRMGRRYMQLQQEEVYDYEQQNPPKPQQLSSSDSSKQLPNPTYKDASQTTDNDTETGHAENDTGTAQDCDTEPARGTEREDNVDSGDRDGLFANDSLLRQATILSTLRNNCDFARDVMVRIQNDIRDCAFDKGVWRRPPEQSALVHGGSMLHASKASKSNATASVTSKTPATETIPLHDYGCDNDYNYSIGGGVHDYGHGGEQDFYSIRSDYYFDCDTINDGDRSLGYDVFSSLQYDTPSSAEWFDADTDSFCTTRSRPDPNSLPPMFPWRRGKRRNGGSSRTRIGAAIGQPLRVVRNTVRNQWERRNPRRPESHPDT